MDLKCLEVVCEIADNNVAEKDKAISHDPRVIRNLLALERATIPHLDYFRLVQADLKPFMRKIVTTWMLEVCDEQHCEEQVFPLAVNYMDRFLCLCPISRQTLQLLGTCCLLLASKIRQCHALTVDLLCAYTDHSVTPEQIRSWELLVVSTLQWNLSAVTGFDYIDHILERVPWGAENAHIRQHALTLVSVCYTETTFIQITPSLLASACICAATRGINSPSAPFAFGDICRLIQIDPFDVEFTVRHIEQVVAKETAALQKQVYKAHPYASQSTGKIPSSCAADIGQPETPTDIQDVYF
ncbi:G1/S-specific cyclin-D2-like [Culicoides brevitarsis]|uniref:G1/S-specific cyclin-D2-like n=1 Tax=Culicoides brevitarsis TaxID=469753 RepID=UPI00307B5943